MLQYNKISTENKVIILSVFFGFVVGAIDSIINTYVFTDESILEQIFFPSPYEIYIRGLMLLIFILFGLITSRIISKLKRSEEEKQKMISDLITINEEIKTLRGIIPICSSCKKIRDDDGYWHQVEVYIHDHSEADFTHGICPDCLNKFYKDFMPN